MKFSLLGGLGERLRWVLRNGLVMAVAYGLSGGLIGAAVGWTNAMAPMSVGPLWQWVGGTFLANGVTTVVMGAIITGPIFLFLYSFIPQPRDAKLQTERRNQVIRVMLFPSALLQTLLPFTLAAIYQAVPSSRSLFDLVQLSSRPGDVGGVLVQSQYALLLLGSLVGGMTIALFWHLSQVKSQREGSRLLPLD